MAVRTAYDPTAGEVLTATNLERLAGGWIGYAEVTANQTSITTEVDLSGLSVTVTVGTSRRIRITGSARVTNGTANGTVTMVIKEGATPLKGVDATLPSTSGGHTIEGSIVLTPTSGSHTYKLAMSAGGGTGLMAAAADNPAFILVEDVGVAS